MMKTKLHARLLAIALFLFIFFVLASPMLSWGISFQERPPLFYINSNIINTNSKEFILGITLLIVIVIYHIVLKPTENTQEKI